VSECHKTALRNFAKNTSDPKLLLGSLEEIADALTSHHNAPVIVLIDEYDAPFNQTPKTGFDTRILMIMRQNP
jgi:hypothetical protein